MEILEAIESLKNNNELCLDNCEGECGSYKDGKCYCADALVVSALEEYIAIGTVQELEQISRDFKRQIEHSEKLSEVLDSTKNLLKKRENILNKYYEIGTVEECREAKERQAPKKPIRVDVGHNGSSTDGCPVCKREFYEKFNFCPDCGTYLDWSEK